MSGPIIRKYGFPNFDQIFGKRELQHGVDDETPEAEKQLETEKKAEETSSSKPAEPKKC